MCFISLRKFGLSQSNQMRIKFHHTVDIDTHTHITPSHVACAFKTSYYLLCILSWIEAEAFGCIMTWQAEL